MITINSFKWLCTILFTIGTLSAFSQSTPCDPNNPVVPSVVLYSPSTTICAVTPVSFVTTSYNSGTAPTYVWKKNNVVIPNATAPVYSTASVTNNDVFTVEMTSNAECVSTNTAVSNLVFITVQSEVVADVIIVSDKNSICAGEKVTFTANGGNGGSGPLYEWFVNAVSQGVSSGLNEFTSTTLKNGDKVSVKMYGNSGCANPKDATSTPIEMVVNPNLIPSVILVPDKSSICEGESVRFTATPTNGGTAPTYTWKDGVNTLTGTSVTYTATSLTTGNKITVTLNSTETCVTNPTAVSTPVEITVTPISSPTVTITRTPTTICNGGNVIFTATPTEEGNAPTYKWYINTTVQSITTNVFSTTLLTSTDDVWVEMVSNKLCAPTTAVASNKVKTTVNAGIGAGTLSADQTICYNSVPKQITEVTAPTNISNASNVTYLWEASLDGNTGWTTFPGVTAKDYTPSPLAALTQDIWIRRKVTDAGSPAPCNVATTPAVHIKVNPQLVAGAIESDRLVCKNWPTMPILSVLDPTGGDGIYYYNWEQTTGNGEPWTIVTGQHSSIFFTPNNLPQISMFRRIEYSCGQSVTSNVSIIQLMPDEYCTTAIEDEQITQQPKTISTIYNLQGVEVDKFYKGLVIYKYIDGTIQKVVQE